MKTIPEFAKGAYCQELRNALRAILLVAAAKGATQEEVAEGWNALKSTFPEKERINELENALEDLRDRTSCTQAQYTIIDSVLPPTT